MPDSIEMKSTPQDHGHENRGFTNDEESFEPIQSTESHNDHSISNVIGNGKPVETKSEKTQEIPKKDEWGGGLEFLMSCIANSVGLGNVWRFSFTAYENGGGAFLIPYIIVLFLVGKPFYYLEGLLGQFTGKSCTSCWNMAPAMRGVGYGQVLAGFIVLSYYCSLMALTLYYLGASLQSTLPWSYCREEWGNECVSGKLANNTFNRSGGMSSAELYFKRIVLNEVDSIENGIGNPSWILTICLFLSWAAIFGITCKGVKSSGKVAYFLAIFPYLVLIILLIRAVTLDGAINGILFFITPQWGALLKPTVWYAAITQCFFSLGVCFGPIIAYSSHNNFAHKISRDIMVVTTLDTFTSLLAGCTIFGILGNLAFESGSNDISTVVKGGTGLAFVSYPDALSRFSFVPQLFSVLFFFMMFVLGAGSAVALFQAANGIVEEKYPQLATWKRVMGFSTLGFLLGLIYITPGGQWLTTLIDYYGGTFIAIVTGVAEIVTVMWIYGLYNFLNDAEYMIGERPGLYWRVCWVGVTPLLMIVILIYTIIIYEPVKYAGKLFPHYAYVIGWTILIVGILQFFFWMIVEVLNVRKTHKLSLRESIKAAFLPNESKWGPEHAKKREEWKEFVACKKFRRQKTLTEMFLR